MVSPICIYTYIYVYVYIYNIIYIYIHITRGAQEPLHLPLRDFLTFRTAERPATQRRLIDWGF